MADFIVHDKTTNSIIRYGNCHEDDVSLQALEANEAVLAVTYQPGTVVNGALVPLSASDLAAQQLADRKTYIAEQIAQKKMWASL